MATRPTLASPFSFFNPYPIPCIIFGAPSFNASLKADDLAQEMEDVDFEEEEEEEEGNDEGWVLEPQEGVVGSMEGPDDSEVTFALHSGRPLNISDQCRWAFEYGLLVLGSYYKRPK